MLEQITISRIFQVIIYDQRLIILCRQEIPVLEHLTMDDVSLVQGIWVHVLDFILPFNMKMYHHGDACRRNLMCSSIHFPLYSDVNHFNWLANFAMDVGVQFPSVFRNE